jgi:curved DNA-binding protein CbpA
MATIDDGANYYEVLGVAEDAPAEEIKRAYFRLVREFRPDHHPELFQRFSLASRTLTDARRRNEYDQLRRAGRRVQVLVDQAAIAADKDPVKAMTLLKSAIAIAPDTARPRLLLAQVLMRMGEHEMAEKQYRWLLKEAPRDETLHLKLARCLLAQDRGRRPSRRSAPPRASTPATTRPTSSSPAFTRRGRRTRWPCTRWRRRSRTTA